MQLHTASLAALILSLAATGCATSRSEISLGGAPAVASLGSAASGRTVLIRSVKDERIFEEAPADPSIPSLGKGGAAKATAETRARAVGRKRGGFGKALGDVLLQPGQTVESVVRDHLSAALRQAGYRVVNQPSEAGASALVLDARIKQFWAWFTPGFAAITLSANIATDLVVAGTPAPVVVSVHAEDSRQIATESAWIQIIDKALQEYRAQAAAEVAKLP